MRRTLAQVGKIQTPREVTWGAGSGKRGEGEVERREGREEIFWGLVFFCLPLRVGTHSYIQWGNSTNEEAIGPAYNPNAGVVYVAYYAHILAQKSNFRIITFNSTSNVLFHSLYSFPG
jgi:hypothetical protein